MNHRFPPAWSTVGSRLGVVDEPLPVGVVAELVRTGRKLQSAAPTAIPVVKHRVPMNVPIIEVTGDAHVASLAAIQPKLNHVVRVLDDHPSSAQEDHRVNASEVGALDAI